MLKEIVKLMFYKRNLCVEKSIVQLSPVELSRYKSEIQDFIESAKCDKDYRLWGNEIPVGLLRIGENMWQRAVNEGLVFPEWEYKPMLNLVGAGYNSGGGWHRDSLDDQVKLFCYLTDVDDLNGPFTYLPGTNDRLKVLWDVLFRAKDKKGLRVDVVDKASIKIVGQRGTFWYARTDLLHRGSTVQRGHRIMLTLYINKDKRKNSVFK